MRFDVIVVSPGTLESTPNTAPGMADTSYRKLVANTHAHKTMRSELTLALLMKTLIRTSLD